MDSPLSIFLQANVVIATFLALVISTYAHLKRIPTSGETYDLNSGAIVWLLGTMLFWPYFLPFFLLRRKLPLGRKAAFATETESLTLPSLAVAVGWATYWWCLVLLSYAVVLVPHFARQHVPWQTGVVPACFLLGGLVVGPLSGFVDWCWFRKLYFSKVRRRAKNPAGNGVLVCGILAGAVLGLTPVLPFVSEWDGPGHGAVIGAVLGLIVSVLYKYSAILMRSGTEVPTPQRATSGFATNNPEC